MLAQGLDSTHRSQCLPELPLGGPGRPGGHSDWTRTEKRPDTSHMQIVLGAVIGNYWMRGLNNTFVSCNSDGCKTQGQGAG